MSRSHPYRESEALETARPPPRRRLLPEDLAVALLLLTVGALAVGVGFGADRVTERLAGAAAIALALKVGWDAFRSA